MKLEEVIEHFLLDCENRSLAQGTIVLYARVLGVLARRLEQVAQVTELEAVTLLHLRQFVNFLLNPKEGEKRFPDDPQTGGLSAHTTVTYVHIIKAFFRWCLAEDLLDKDLAARLAAPKVPERVLAAFTPEHVEKMLGACDTDTVLGFRDYVMLLVLLDTGIRVSELCKLRLSDVYPRYIKVFGKGRKEREIGMHPEVGKLLWKYIHKYRRASDPAEDHVFLGWYGSLTPGAVEAMVLRVKRRSGVENVRVTPHVFRHTFAKWYLMRGGDLFKLSRELGHSGVQVTGNIYLGDFHSTHAREDHDEHSPIGRLDLIDKRRGANKNGASVHYKRKRRE